MTRTQLEHLIRAAADISDDTDIVVIGSQAVLGQFPDAPASMRVSAEADTYNYYAQGVSETTATLPQGWKDRLIVVQNANTRQARGLCLEVHDLLASKALAGRDKDIDFISEAAKHGLADKNTLLSRLATVNAPTQAIERAQALVRRSFSEESV
jgi:hypothetical protein